MSIAAPLACTCVVSAVDVLSLSTFGINWAPTLDLLLLDRGGVVGLAVDDDNLVLFVGAVAEPSGRLGLTHDPAPDCECREGEATPDSWAPPTARCACDCDGLLKDFGTCDSPGRDWGRSSVRANTTSVQPCRAPSLHPYSRVSSHSCHPAARVLTH